MVTPGSGARSTSSNQSQSARSIKNFPYRCKRSYEPTSQEIGLGAIQLPIHTEGEVLSEVQPMTGWVRVSIGQGSTFRMGIVPLWAIEVGGPRKVGDRIFIHDIPTIQGLYVNPARIAGNTPFHKAVRGLALAFKTHQSQLPFLSDEMRDMLNNDHQRENFVSSLFSGIPSEFVRIVTGGNPTLATLTNRLPRVTGSDPRHGLYLRITSQFTADPNKLPESYVGMTAANEGFWGRLDGHRYPSADETTMAAESVRQSRRCEMYPICVTTGTGLYFALIEQLMILVIGTYGYRLTDWIANNQSRGSLGLDSVVTTWNNRESGKLLLEIAGSVFRDIGWIPLCHRPSFGVSRSLNYASPLRGATLMGEKLLWTLTVQPNVKAAYRRTPLKPHLSGNSPSLHVLKGQTYTDAYAADKKSKDRKTFFTISYKRDEPYPDVNVEVTAVFEIMLNGTQHPYCYARLPDIGRYSDWKKANTLAVRIEWQEQGVWKTRYVQREGRNFMGTNDPGPVRTYVEALGIIRYLQQTTQDQPRGWDITHGLARVKQISVDHMTQTARIQEVPPLGLSMPAAIEKSPQTVANEVRLLGAYNPNGPWRAWHPGVSDYQTLTRKCDGCYIDDRYKGTRQIPSGKGANWGCVQRLNASGQPTNICTDCHFKGMVCSWTQQSLFTPAMITSLGYKEYLTPTVITFDRDAYALTITDPDTAGDD